jgi:hypothetical protein
MKTYINIRVCYTGSKIKILYILTPGVLGRMKEDKRF